MEPRVQYAKTSDGINIAYAVFGSGPAIVFPSMIWGNIHTYKSGLLGFNRTYDELVSLGWSVITYDGRGTGSSDRDVEDYTLEERMQDLEAVIDRVGPDRFALCGILQGGPAAITYAVQHADRVSHLVLSDTFANAREYYELIPALRMTQLTLRDADDEWEFATLTLANALTGYTDTELARRMAETFRTGMTAKAYMAFRNAAEEIDVQHLLPQIGVPTLVVHDRSLPIERVGVLAQRLAPLIPNARLVETNDAADVIDEFQREGEEPGRVPPDLPSGTAIILFADIADSTALTERLGDAAFRDKARELDDALRRAITSNGGTAIDGKLLGDGVLATFGAAREAIACASEMHRLAAGAVGGLDPRPMTLDPLSLHVGIHAGDVIREANNVYGGAVNIAARVAAEAAAGETLVSRTVADLARTSAGVSFEDRGERALKGVSEPVRVYAVGEQQGAP